MSRFRLVSVVGAVSAVLGATLSVAPTAGASVAPASPVSLLVTTAAAAQALGYVCSGPTQTDWATGFDAVTGQPDGVAEVSTTCSGSGRDPGSHTYYGWLSASWDFTGYMTSYTVLGSAPTVDPGLAVFDTHGNGLSNPGAVLTLAPGYYPTPKVFAVNPSTAPQQTVIGITGDGFTGTTSVRFGTHPATFVVNSDTSITATVPAVLSGTVDIRVTNPGGTSAASGADRFTFNRTPLVSAVSPNSGTTDGGNVVMLTGVNFTGATIVSFGGLPAKFKVLSATSIRAVAPGAADPTTVYIVVGNKYGFSVATSADVYTFR
jgi:hypothetical protein